MDNFEQRKDNLVEKLKFVYNRMLKQNGIILNITSSLENFDSIETKFIKFLNEFDFVEDESYSFEFEKENLKEAIATSSDVNYVTFVADLKPFIESYKGSFSLLSKILSTTYMHNNVRAVGGAYGAGFSISRDMDVIMFSYRDPNIIKTKDTFKNIFEYVSKLEISNDELENFKISVVKDFDPLLSTK